MDVDLRFESIVNFLSSCEDQYGLDLNELNLNIRENLKNYKTFFELLDFYYGYNDLKISIVANNSNTPFEIMLNVFNQYEISTYTNYGISLNLDHMTSNPWYSNDVFKSIDKFVLNGFSEMDSKYLVR